MPHDRLERPGEAYAERVTRRFFQRFKLEHARFLSFMRGFRSLAEREWYASLMLNRLMFIYFIQKRGFLDGDRDYLRTWLDRMPAVRGADQSITFYRYFLRRLFHEGLGRPPESRAPDLVALLGDVLYLNSGLFDHYQLERENPEADIADEAFVQVFDFFDGFEWVLDDRPLSDERQVNPDLLGYVFEQYINKKQTGAYYTQDDITAYIARNTIIPALFDAAMRRVPSAFSACSTTWDRLSQDPDRYIYADVLKGLDVALPADIAAGCEHIALRAGWNHAAAADYALAKETWRECIARRKRGLELRALLSSGGVRAINDCITHNLDIMRFAQDFIAGCTDPQALQSFYHAMEQISVLDPTCGSGAFLLAALHVLEPLYTACLERMRWFVRMGDRPEPRADRAAIADFRAILAQVERHHNSDYFVRTSIVTNNLYGVDLMKEAVEICKLRLFLKIVAPIEDICPIEPLPDIDFNVRAGNALVGFASDAAVRRAIRGDLRGELDLDDAMCRIHERAATADHMFQEFRTMQLAPAIDPDQRAAKKAQLRRALDDVSAELDRYLAGAYGIVLTDRAADTPQYELWRDSHQPFQWYAEFYGILRRGGFDVIIGNPPYVLHSRVRDAYTIQDYQTESCGNLYAFVMERSLALLREQGRCGMILPIASVSTAGMRELQALYTMAYQWHSHYAVRPGKLFAGVDMNLTISLFQKTDRAGPGFTTRYHRWSNGLNSDRRHLFATLAYIPNPGYQAHVNRFPKIGSGVEIEILRRMLEHGHKLHHYVDPSGTTLYYHSGGRYWRKALLSRLSSHYKPISVRSRLAPVAFALLNSQLFYWYWISNSNCMDLVSREVLDLPVFALEQANTALFEALSRQLLDAYDGGSSLRSRRGQRINTEETNFDLRQAKPIIDRIDRLLAAQYGLSDEELDFILNYDIKYRVTDEARTYAPVCRSGFDHSRYLG